MSQRFVKHLLQTIFAATLLVATVDRAQAQCVTGCANDLSDLPFVSATTTNNLVSDALSHAANSGALPDRARNRAPFAFSGKRAAPVDPWSGWATASARGFDGDLDGDGQEVTLGIDKAIGTSRVGFVLSYGTYSVTDTLSTQIDADSVSYGPYFMTPLNDTWSLQGFALFSDPDYTVGTTSFSNDRISGGLTLGAVYEVGSVVMASFVGVNAFSEDQPVVGLNPARTLSGTSLKVETLVYFQTQGALLPYVGVSLHLSRFDDGLGNTTTNLAPRLSAGFETTGDNGTFTMDFDVGEVAGGTTDYGITVGYFVQF